jgi:sterol desaturase/sphingolipid hydroxylase (fatty acid hydroxylase superfamily)
METATKLSPIDIANVITATAALVGVTSSILEAVGLKFFAKRDFDWRAFLTSFALFFGYVFLTALIPIAIALPGAFWLYEHRLFDLSGYGVWSYVLLLLGLEFLYYWQHRFYHRVRWGWVSHVVHHTSNDLNIATSYRIGWTGKITATYFVLAPLVVLGFDPATTFAFYGALIGYQFWLHADWIPKLGFLEGILNTPSAHRVHHGGNLEYVDANYGGVLMIFDRMFGTYRPELDDVPVRYGLVVPLHTYNPFKARSGSPSIKSLP